MATTGRGASLTLRAVLGAAQLTWPARIVRLAGGPAGGARVSAVIRILGARQLLQALVTGLRPTPSVLAAGAGADAIHAMTMIALGLYKRQWRRAALQEASLASWLALAEARAARSR